MDRNNQAPDEGSSSGIVEVLPKESDAQNPVFQFRHSYTANAAWPNSIEQRLF